MYVLTRKYTSFEKACKGLNYYSILQHITVKKKKYFFVFEAVTASFRKIYLNPY